MKSLAREMFRHKQIARAASSCAQLYLEPTTNQQVEAYSNTTIQWDPNCITSSQFIDVFLYEALGSAAAPLHGWTRIPTSDRTLTVELKASWWNATAAGPIDLRFQVVDAGDPVWASSYAVGPTFIANWNGTTPVQVQQPSGPSTNQTVEAQTIASPDDGLSAGKLAAAVMFPLLAIIAALAGYIFYSRRKSKSTTKRWSKVLDKRMSEISAAGSAYRPPPPRPGSYAASYLSGAHNRSASSISATHNRSGSSGSFFAHANSSFTNVNPDRHSTVSFATAPSPAKERAANRQNGAILSATFPRLGQNGRSSEDLLALPPAKRAHTHQTSVSSSLRHQVRNSNIFGDEELAGAVSYIKNDRPSMDRSPSETLSFEHHSANSSIGSHHAISGHSREPSAMSFKMPMMARSSTLSPDDSLALYSSNKQALQVKVKPSISSQDSFGLAL